MKRAWATPQVQSRSRCLFDGCDRFEELTRGRPIDGHCAGHRKQKQRGQPLTPLGDAKAKRLTRRQRLLEAVLKAAECDADELDAALKRILRVAAEGRRNGSPCRR
jgi:hypothetical protein